MSQQVTGKKISTARILVLLSVLSVPGILAGSHKLYLGKHISWFFYFFPVIISGIVLITFDVDVSTIHYNKNKIFILFYVLLFLIYIISIIDLILLFNSKYQQRLSKVMETKPFTNELGQYPINNPSFVYVVLGGITFLSILCFWASKKILCLGNLSNYLGDVTSKCIWLVTGDKNNLSSLLGATYRRLLDELASVYANMEIVGIILLFIGGIIFLWHYQSKSKRSFNQNNQNMPNIPNNNFQSNDEVTNALTNLKRLYDTGAITEAEYNEKRQKYLDSL
jgi:hypothetical protein